MDQAQSANPADRPCLLFVDTSPLMRKTARHILSEEFEVMVAPDQQQAWQELAATPLIQVVFFALDHQASTQLIERIRSAPSPRIRQTPIVVIADENQTEAHRVKLLKLGASDFIDKPFRPSELLARARALATSARAQQRLADLRKNHNLDSSSGLGNRRYFFERLNQALSFACRHQQPLSLLHVHLDGLTRALQAENTHAPGISLARLGRLLARSVRNEDSVYRTDPETFSVILPATGLEGAEAVRFRLAPELDEVGLLQCRIPSDVQCRYSIQEIELDPDKPVKETLSQVRQGMGSRLMAEHSVNPPDSGPITPDLDNLLALANSGDSAALKTHLPEVLDKLKPLIEMANKLKDGSSS
jgi:two-component system, cell cycle response regulator